MTQKVTKIKKHPGRRPHDDRDTQLMSEGMRRAP